MKLDSYRQTVPLLAALSTEAVDLLSAGAEETVVPEAALIFEEGGAADSFYVLISGRVGLELAAPGRSPMVLQTLGAGELVGISWMFPPYRWSWRARALTDCNLLVFDATHVRRNIESDPELERQLLRTVAVAAVDRMQSSRTQLLDLYRNPA